MRWPKRTVAMVSPRPDGPPSVISRAALVIRSVCLAFDLASYWSLIEHVKTSSRERSANSLECQLPVRRFLGCRRRRLFTMKCFQFRNESTKGEFQARLSASVRSNSTTSTERDMRRSGSEFNSGDVTDSGTDSVGRPQYPSFSQRPINLRVFTFSELRNATKNFSRSLMVGEGGFGCVYRGTIKSLDDPDTKTEIAIKQLNRKGLQARFFFLAYFFLLCDF
ncbi:hypothetical protein BHE74_00031753 [Ensete ventricosum]|nr:hypothetical protein BHE74_00031753 [Ensete ventricosum]